MNKRNCKQTKEAQIIETIDNMNLLNYAVAHGIINLDDVRKNAMNEQRQHYLSMHKYSIFQDKKDGRWKTTIPDSTKKTGRRLVANKNRSDLENEIINYYKNEEEYESQKHHRLENDITLEELYPIWLESRILEVNNIRTVKRNDQEWRRYYKDTPITKKPMRLLTINELKDWAHKMIDDNHFNKRDYYDMALIIKKSFEFLADEGICENTWLKVKINTKKLRKNQKSENISQIYFIDEKLKLVKYSLDMFMQRPWNITALVIPFLFITGLRIGEVVALKYEDLTDNEIIIRNSEVNNYEYEDGKFVYRGKKIEDHAKTDAGIRNVPYTNGAKKIIQMIQKSSEYYGYYDNGYIFCPSSKRIVSNTIDHKLYSYCDAIGIPKKSAHKIRKTYISQIIQGGVDLDTVCRISGHVDLKTTFDSYLFCLDRKDKVYEKFNELFESVV